MARSISDIQNALISQVQGDPVLGPKLTSTSRVALWRLWTYIIAVCQWTLENLYDLFVADVNTLIATLKPHSTKWYAEKAKEFEFGQPLDEDNLVYDNSALSDDEIAASKVVSYAAVIEQVINGRNALRIKIATTAGNDLAPLPGDQLSAFVEYMRVIKDAGVKLVITTNVADALKLSLDFYYDPLILNSSGQRNDGTDMTPVPSAIDTFLKNLPFNGIFSINQLNDAIQKVLGYKDLKINYALVQYGLLPFTSVNVTYIPDSGYLRIFNPMTDLLINFIPYSE